MSRSLAVSSLGVWGLYTAEVSATLAGSTDHMPALLGGSAIGLAAGIVLQVPPLRARPAVIGLADAGGVLGGSLGAPGASFSTDERDPILIASLVGSGIGAAGGALAGAALQRKGRIRAVSLHRPSLPGHWSVAPTALYTPEGAVPGVLVQAHGL